MIDPGPAEKHDNGTPRPDDSPNTRPLSTSPTDLGSRPRVLDRSAYIEGRADVEDLISPLLQQTQVRTMEIQGPGIGL